MVADMDGDNFQMTLEYLHHRQTNVASNVKHLSMIVILIVHYIIRYLAPLVAPAPWILLLQYYALFVV